MKRLLHHFERFIALSLAVLQFFSGFPVNQASADECPVYGTHQFGELQFEGDHPHKEYYACDCGFAKYTGTNRSYYDQCDICNCTHSSTTERLIETQYQKYSENEHVVNRYYEVVCQTCGTVFPEDRQESEYEAHSWDENGKCTVCNYQCLHASETRSLWDTQVKKYDEDQHEIVKIYDVISRLNSSCVRAFASSLFRGHWK